MKLSGEIVVMLSAEAVVEVVGGGVVMLSAEAVVGVVGSDCCHVVGFSCCR